MICLATLRKHLAACLLLCVVTSTGATPLPVEVVNQILDRHFPPKALPAATSDHSTLPSIAEIKQQFSNPEVSFKDKVRLVHRLGKQKLSGTDKLVINFAESLRLEEKKPKSIQLKSIYFLIFNALSAYDDTSAAIDYANRLLGDKSVDPVVQARALYFLADQSLPEAKHWAQQFYRNSAEPELQYAALYLGSQLRIEALSKEAVNFLKHLPKSDKTYKQEIYLLLDSLVKTQSAETIETIIRTIKASNANFLTDQKINAYRQMAQLYNGDDKQRKQAALSLIQGWQSNKNEIEQSLKQLISINDATPYADLWRMHHPVLTRHLLQLGYRIDMNSKPIGFKAISADYSRPIPEPEGLIESLLNSFKRGNIDRSLFLNQDLLAKLQPDQGSDKTQQAENAYNNYQANIIASWKTVYQKLPADAVDWTDLSYQSYTADTFVTKEGGYISTLKVHLQGKNKKPSILSSSAVLMDNHWYIFSGVSWL